MAQKVQVLDIGSYSAKSVVAKVPFVGFQVTSAKAEKYHSALEPKTRRSEQTRAARDLLPGKRLTGDAVTVVMQADRIMNRTVELPFTDRGKIDQVLGFELENHVPYTADEIVYDYVVREKSKEGAKLFVSVAPRKDIEEYAELFGGANIDPRVMGHQALANARLKDLLGDTEDETVAFVDIGHRKTVITIVDPSGLLGCRTVVFGGWDLTRALAEQFSLDPSEAEREKHGAHLYPAGEGLAVGRLQEVADCLTQTLRPLARDMRQAFKALGDADRVFIFGGSAKLNGLDSFLRTALGKSVEQLFPSMLKLTIDQSIDKLEYVSAVAQGYYSQKGGDSQRVSFRQGEFAYEGDFRFVRGRLVYLALMAVFIFSVLAAPQVMKYRSFVQQAELLQVQLAELSSTILGEELEDWQEILDQLEEMPPAEVWTVFPDLTAHDVFWEVADIVARIEGQPTGEKVAPEVPEEAVVEGAVDGQPGAGVPPSPDSPGSPPPDSPPSPGVDGLVGETGAPVEVGEAIDIVHRLEFNQVKIDGASRTALGEGAVEFTGNASSVATMELFLSMLGQHPCFHNVQRTKQEMLKATAGKEGWWRFTVDFNVSCPKKAAEELKKEREGEGAVPGTEEGVEGKEGKVDPAGGEEKAAPPTPAGEAGKGGPGAGPGDAGAPAAAPSKPGEKEGQPDKGGGAAPADKSGEAAAAAAETPPGKAGRDKAPLRKVGPGAAMGAPAGGVDRSVPIRPVPREVIKPQAMPKMPRHRIGEPTGRE